MRWTQVVALSLFAVLPAAAQQRAVAVAPFETEGSVGLSRDDYDALGRALAAVLATELDERREGSVTTVTLPAATRPGRVDLPAARAAATAAGAPVVIVGTLLDQYGDLHLEAKVIEAATGATLGVVAGDPALGTRDRMSEGVADLAGRLVRELSIGGVPEARWRRNLPITALVQLGRGLRAEAGGDRAAAATAYRAAIAGAPTLDEAKRALTRVGG